MEKQKNIHTLLWEYLWDFVTRRVVNECDQRDAVM